MKSMIHIAKEHGNIQAARNLYGLKCVSQIVKLAGAINRLGGDYFFDFEYSPIPSVTQTTKSFSEVSISAAEKIWSKNKHVCLFWSGGIDSTTALVALILTNNNWKDSLTVYTSRYAIEVEYPGFYNQHLKDADVRLLKDLEFYDTEIYENDHVFVDGFCGGQLWGSNRILEHPDLWKKPHSEFYSKLNFKRSDLVIDYIEMQREKFPIEIKTVPDLFWMLSFTHRWDPVKRRHMSCVPDERHIHRMNCFFDTEEFQQWAMSNMQNKIGETWCSFKQPAKDFIYSFTRDDEYRVNKTQVESLQKTIGITNLNLRYYFLLVTSQGLASKNEPFIDLLMSTVKKQDIAAP